MMTTDKCNGIEICPEKGEAMEFMEVFKGRRSIRKYRPDPVPNSLIEEILSEARWCPSWANTQVWEVMVVQGDILDKFRQGQMEKVAVHAEHKPDVPTPDDFRPNGTIALRRLEKAAWMRKVLRVMIVMQEINTMPICLRCSGHLSCSCLCSMSSWTCLTA